MKNSDALIRPQVRGFLPYLPGRSIESVKREYHLARIIKLASNENPLGPSTKALTAMRHAGPQLFLYPDGASVSLRNALAKHARVTSDRVIIGAGSDELIELLGKNVFKSWRFHCRLRTRLHPLQNGRRSDGRAGHHGSHAGNTRIDLAAMGRAVRPDTKIIFIANPNNPTGTHNSQSELVELLKKVAQGNASREKTCPRCRG